MPALVDLVQYAASQCLANLSFDATNRNDYEDPPVSPKSLRSLSALKDAMESVLFLALPSGLAAEFVPWTA